MTKLNYLLRSFVILAILFILPAGNLSSQNFALKMSNSAQAVLFDNVPANPGTQWTAEMWVKRNTQSNFSTLIDGATSKFTLETWASGNAWTYKVGFSKKGTGDQAFNYVMPLNTWTHLAYVCNGASVTLYVNGESKGSINQVIDLPLKGFGLLGTPNESALASIDEVRYWKGVRTVAQIRDNMYKSVDTNSANLIAYWYFDDKATKITDLSASNITGTNQGCTYVANDNASFVSSHAAMTFDKIQAFHSNEYFLKAGTANQEMLCVQINTQGVSAPLSLTSLIVSTQGTSDKSKITKVAVANTANSAVFSSGTLFGAKVSPNGNEMTFTGNIQLKPGKNYLWVMYDISADAAQGDIFDAGCVSAVVDGQTIALNSFPKGNRTVDSEVKVAATGINLIPQPGQMTVLGGNLTLTNNFKIKYSGENVATQADSLKAFLSRATGFSFDVSEGAAVPNSIALSLITDVALGNEGYKLDVNNNQITIKAQTPIGLFWGTQTLRQLLPPAIENRIVQTDVSWVVPYVSITDVPRFKLRSMHLDVARHFFPAEFIKKYIDMLAMYKINTFHWHLTEDQGWRIEIKKYPKLQSVSAWRTCSGVKYGGYYTQEEIKDIVAYASSRNVDIIPEIEMPGHSVAVLAAYPEYACSSAVSPFSVRCAWGISNDILCGGKAEVREFLKDVLMEVVELFPGKYIHIGGDEAPKNNWNTCTHCQQRIADLGITGANQTAKSNTLQKNLVEEMAQFLAPLGKTVIGWDEITHGGIPTGATIQAWNVGVDVGPFTSAGHDVIMSNYTKLYFDSKQSTAADEPGATWMGYNTLEVAYNYDPMPSGLTAAQQAHVLGSEACIWTEELQTSEVVEYMLLPRLQALAERAWSPNSVVNFTDFKSRLLRHYERFELLNFNNRKLETPQNTLHTIKACETVKLAAQATGSSYYWNDENHSVSPEIVVTESGIYKCYVNFLGTTVVNTFDVQIEKSNTTPKVKKKVGEAVVSLQAEGDYDTYYWFDGSPAIFPVAAGKSLQLAADTDLSNYYLSGLNFTSNLNSLQLDGNDDLFVFDNSAFMNNTKAFTFETWVKVRTWREWDVILSKFTDNTNRVMIELGKQGELYSHISKSGAAYGVASGVLNLNTWTHLALVYDASKTGNANRLKLYINGVEKTLTFTGAIPTSTPTVNNPLQLGKATQNPSMNFADVRVWSVARTAAEIADNMYALASFNSNLKRYYPMNNLTDVTVYDLTSGEKATLQNASADYFSTDAAPGVFVPDCESQRWSVPEITYDATGVRPVTNSFFAQVYPNPSNGLMTLYVKLKTVADIEVSISDLTGRVVYTDSGNGNIFKKEISLQAFSKGLYFVKINANNAEQIIKVVLQ